MFHLIFNTIFYLPLYNALVFIAAVLPNHDLGLSVVILTLLVKILLMPVSHKTIHTQKKMKDLEPMMNKIKETHKNDKQEQAAKIMNLYKEHNVNPLSGVLLMFIQLPIILALFFVIKAGVDPSSINPKLFGLIDLGQKSLILAALVGLTQFLQVQISIPPTPPKQAGGDSFGDGLAQSMNFQIKFILPVFIMFVAYNLNVAVSVYWIVNNLFTIAHELYVRKSAEKIISA